MKILWHMPILRKHTCGLSIRALRLASELRRFGHEISFVVANDKTDIRDNCIDGMVLKKPAVVRFRPCHWSLQMTERRRVARTVVRKFDDDHELLISCQPEAVHAYRQLHQRRPVLFVCGGTTLLHDAADVQRHASLSWGRRLLFALDRYLKRCNETSAFRSADAVVFDSRQTRTRVIDAYSVNPEKCYTVYGGLDSKKYRPPEAVERDRCRTQLGLGDHDIAIVWTGRISSEKNLELLIQALPKCRLRPQRVFIVGDGPMRQDLVALCQQEDVEDLVSFVGETTDVASYLHAADIFVFPSRSESFGASLVEAMGSGLPCIALRAENATGGNASEEIFGSEASGLIVRSNEPAAMAQALDDLVHDPSRRRCMGRYASKRAAEKFEWANGGRCLHELILRVFGRSEIESTPAYPRGGQAAVV